MAHWEKCCYRRDGVKCQARPHMRLGEIWLPVDNKKRWHTFSASTTSMLQLEPGLKKPPNRWPKFLNRFPSVPLKSLLSAAFILWKRNPPLAPHSLISGYCWGSLLVAIHAQWCSLKKTNGSRILVGHRTWQIYESLPRGIFDLFNVSGKRRQSIR